MELKQQEVGQIVRKNLSTSSLFLHYGIDFCCGGDRSLESAAKEAGINPDELVTEIEKILASEKPETDFDQLTLDKLIEFILTQHHDFIYNEAPHTLNLMDKVYLAHGNNHPELAEVRELIYRLVADLNNHQMKEERILFPFIREMERLDKNGGELCQSCFGHVSQPIGVMESEHEETGGLLIKLKELTQNFSVPADACVSYSTLYKRLEDFYLNVLQHVHLENNILHVKAIALQDKF